MWNRKEIKEKGKAAYKANRITCILAGFLLTLASGGSSTFSTSSFNEETGQMLNIPPETMKLIISIIGFATVLGFILAVFVFNPLVVGLRKFFYQNSSDSSTGITSKNIGVAFTDGNYTNVVASMFTTDLFTLLWSMLFIVPGVIKALSWRMVPYIMAENPQMTGTEARLKSAQMMQGSKWASFVLDLSFIGWYLLGALTLGILNLLFTTPYAAASDAELYRCLKGETSEQKSADHVSVTENEYVIYTDDSDQA